ncbi:MAG: hypothetical protein U0694_21250 [Anaerolineae bacterium]
MTDRAARVPKDERPRRPYSEGDERPRRRRDDDSWRSKIVRAARVHRVHPTATDHAARVPKEIARAAPTVKGMNVRDAPVTTTPTVQKTVRAVRVHRAHLGMIVPVVPVGTILEAGVQRIAPVAHAAMTPAVRKIVHAARVPSPAVDKADRVVRGTPLAVVNPALHARRNRVQVKALQTVSQPEVQWSWLIVFISPLDL